MVNDGLLCWNCSRPTGITGKVFRNDECPHCMAAMRSCRGCRHFDPLARAQCREPVETAQRDKEKPNYCDFYQHRTVVKTPGGISTQTDTKDSRKSRFDDLFKD